MKKCLKFLEMLKISNNLDFRLFPVFCCFSFLYFPLFRTIFPLFRLREVATLAMKQVNSELLNIGTCNWHVVHNGLKTAMSSLAETKTMIDCAAS